MTRVSNKSCKNILEKKIADKPQEKEVTNFRLEIAHGCLASHLYHVGIYTSPNCPFCGSNEEMDRTQIGRCSALRGSSEVEKYWNAIEAK